MAVPPLQHNDAPGGKVGRRFVCMISVKLLGVHERCWNSQAVHRLPHGDTAARPTCVGCVCNPEAYPPPDGRL